MRAPKTTLLRGAAAFALVAALLPAAADAAETAPHVATNGVSHISGTNAQLEGTVTPEGIATSYIFEYGPNAAIPPAAMPLKTKPVAVPIPVAPAKNVKVGQNVTGLQVGYHYRIVAFWSKNGVAQPPVYGKEKTFSNKKTSQLKFVLPKEREDRIYAVYGGSAQLTGTLKGATAGHGLTLQSTPFPFTAPFTTVPGPVFTSRTGSFVFKLFGLTRNTEYRIVTVDPRPVTSPTVAVRVTPRITLHVKRGGNTSLYRWYGTVTPARNGASVTIQQLLPQKVGSKKEGPRLHSVGATVLKRLSSRSSRFSVVIRLSGSFRYRAYVRLPKGALESGNSTNVLVKAPKATTKHRK